jgi:hypothetical protein
MAERKKRKNKKPKKKKKKKRHVFISHSSQDTWVAKKIAEKVRESGASAFLDAEQIQVGEDFEKEILRYLKKSQEILVLLTPWALKRPYIWAELGAAWVRKMRIAAVLHGLTPKELYKKKEATIFIKKNHLIELNDIDGYFKELRKRARR